MGSMRKAAPVMALTLAGGSVFAVAAPAGAAKPVKTKNFAGWLATPVANPTTASADVVVPTMTCGPSKKTSTVFFSTSLNGTGVQLQVNLSASCAGGSPSYAGQVDFYQGNSDTQTLFTNLAISPGDLVAESVQTTPGFSSSATLTDTTTGQSDNAGGTGFTATAGGSGVLAGANAEGKALAPPNFGSAAFSDVMVGGSALGSAATVTEYVWKKVSTGALDPSGTAFTDTWVS